ncbi:MAG: large subunit ribosomal protein [Chloroflexota bacterium]|jgi:large subunit ribosomal protein L22|nr:large subunit ribosomal protein [Chloroflexota bacterium]
MEVEAIARYMRIPPRKARLVAATVVGLPVREALTVLDFTPRAAAKEVAKVVKSAAANATNNFNQDEDTLFVKSIIVNEGPTLKRGRARARGMYFSIFKRTSHITAVVDTREVAASTRRRRAAAAGAAGAQPASRAKATAAKAEKGAARAEKATAEKLDKKSAAAVAEELEAAPEVIEAIEAEAVAIAEVEEAQAEVAAAVAEEARAEEAEEEAAETTVVPTAEKEASEQADPEKENA